MIDLKCGQNPAKLGMRTWDGGVYITVFLDHLEACEKCRHVQGILIDELNNLIRKESKKSFNDV